MEIVKLPESMKSVIKDNHNLGLYLDNLVKGKKPTERSWLYENLDPDAVLENWLKHLEPLSHGSPYEVKVYQFDTSQLEKWGPQGGVKPISELMDVVEAGFQLAASPQPKAFSTPEWKKALRLTLVQMQQMGIYPGSLRPASYKHVVDDMRARDTLESNSGWPDFARRNLPDVKHAALVAAEDGSWKTYPAIALFRNYNMKTRLVWMFPMSVNIVEGSYYQPLQSTLLGGRDELYRTLNNPWGFYSPWKGFDYVRRQITEAYSSGLYITASDFSSTDAHFTWHATEQVLSVLQTLFPKQFSEPLAETLKYMQTIPLIIGPDEMITGDHGVSSGSNWTNFIETIFDRILSNYVSILHPKWDGMYAIGDDMSWISDEYDDAFADTLARIGEDVGQEIKAEKTTNEKDWVKSLQRLFQRGYNTPEGLTRGVYSTIRALKSSVYPEKFHKPKLWNSDMFCARQYMILENCVDHPLFEEFVKFVVMGQKDLIPFAKKPRAELDRILRETKLLPGLNPTYNQERRDTSLAEFASVKLASTL